MLYVYCDRKSTSAMLLCETLGASRIRAFDGLHFYGRSSRRLKPSAGDTILCWGTSLPDLEGIRIINGGFHGNKLDEIITLSGRNIAVPRVTTTAPARNGLSGEWLPRRLHHAGGGDFIHPPVAPAFWTRKLPIVEEFRIHSFNGRSIRAGMKVKRDGYEETAHPWVRAFDTGWRVKYDGFQSTSAMRSLAHKAVRTLGLTFGAVDLGRTAEGLLYVLEVNRAPGIEDNSVEAYARHITRLLEAAPSEPSQPTQPEAASDLSVEMTPTQLWQEHMNRMASQFVQALGPEEPNEPVVRSWATSPAEFNLDVTINPAPTDEDDDFDADRYSEAYSDDDND